MSYIAAALRQLVTTRANHRSVVSTLSDPSNFGEVVEVMIMP